MPIDASGIYLITNKVNGKVYIGSAIRLKRRWIEHRNRLRQKTHHNSHLQRAWDKYGEDSFHFSILQCCNKDELLESETSYIKFFKASDEAFGYNICEQGRNRLGAKHSEETKAKIGAVHKGKKLQPYQIEAVIKANTGRKVTDEFKKKVSEFWKGRKHPPLTETQKALRRSVNIEMAHRRWKVNPMVLDLNKEIKL